MLFRGLPSQFRQRTKPIRNTRRRDTGDALHAGADAPPTRSRINVSVAVSRSPRVDFRSATDLKSASKSRFERRRRRSQPALVSRAGNALGARERKGACWQCRANCTLYLKRISMLFAVDGVADLGRPLHEQDTFDGRGNHCVWLSRRLCLVNVWLRRG